MFWIPLLIAATAVSTAASAAASLQAGQLSKAGNKASAEAARIEAANSRLRATQTAELSRQRLSSVLATQQAVFAQRGTSGNSATAQAIERRTIDQAYRDEGAAVLAELNRASASETQARGYSMAAKYAMPLAVADAVSTVAKGTANIAAAKAG